MIQRLKEKKQMLLIKKHTMRLVSTVISIHLLAWNYQAQASTLNRGGISFLEKCPGDRVVAKQSGSIRTLSGVIPALLTPLITGAVDFALESTGERLSNAASDDPTKTQADFLHTGSYFYIQKKGTDPREPENPKEITYWDQKSWCLIVASKATKATNNTVTNLVEGYTGYTFEIDPKTRKRSYVSKPNYPQATINLVNKLEKLGFKGKLTPGVLAVFDFEVSDQRNTFRLVPRFVVMDHSIREKKVDKRSRDITFTFKFAIPENDGVKELNLPLVKVEGLKINKPFQNNLENPILTSHWIVRPKNDAKNSLEDTGSVVPSQGFVGLRGRTFDLTIEISEFRKRPIAKFLGGLLSDPDKRQQFVTPIVEAVDPATSRDIQAEKANQQVILKEKLGELIDQAEKARREYEAASPGKDKEDKKDFWRSQQRAANLQAWEAGITIPYPDAGLFRTTAPRGN